MQNLSKLNIKNPITGKPQLHYRIAEIRTINNVTRQDLKEALNVKGINQEVIKECEQGDRVIPKEIINWALKNGLEKNYKDIYEVKENEKQG